jgi:hypothetical protein
LLAVTIQLEGHDERMLSGAEGEAARTAMRIVVAMAEVAGTDRLVDVASAHVDGCLYHGQVSLDFAERLVEQGAKVRVSTSLNVGSLDLIHPELYRGDPETATAGRRLMDLYVEMGCRPTWTCAPYQLDSRPAFGEHVAWAESNAIVFANSVLGARTDRYGDFIDICAAVTGRVPDAGLHRTERRRGRVVFRLSGLPDRVLEHDQVLERHQQAAFRAEVRRFIEDQRLPVVIVHPSTPVGRGDIKPTPTGRMIREAALGRIPAYVDTGLNIVHVDDVAAGHVLAFEKGVVGERYILGGTNLKLAEVLAIIAELTGRRAPSVRLPRSLVLPIAYLSELWAGLATGREPLTTVAGVRMARHCMFYSSAKAERELGYRARPAREALADAVAWFVALQSTVRARPGLSAALRPRS